MKAEEYWKDEWGNDNPHIELHKKQGGGCLLSEQDLYKTMQSFSDQQNKELKDKYEHFKQAFYESSNEVSELQIKNNQLQKEKEELVKFGRMILLGYLEGLTDD